MGEDHRTSFAEIYCGVLHRNSRTSACTKKSIKQNANSLRMIYIKKTSQLLSNAHRDLEVNILESPLDPQKKIVTMRVA